MQYPFAAGVTAVGSARTARARELAENVRTVCPVVGVTVQIRPTAYQRLWLTLRLQLILHRQRQMRLS